MMSPRPKVLSSYRQSRRALLELHRIIENHQQRLGARKSAPLPKRRFPPSLSAITRRAKLPAAFATHDAGLADSFLSPASTQAAGPAGRAECSGGAAAGPGLDAPAAGPARERLARRVVWDARSVLGGRPSDFHHHVSLFVRACCLADAVAARSDGIDWLENARVLVQAATNDMRGKAVDALNSLCFAYAAKGEGERVVELLGAADWVAVGRPDEGTLAAAALALARTRSPRTRAALHALAQRFLDSHKELRLVDVVSWRVLSQEDETDIVQSLEKLFPLYGRLAQREFERYAKIVASYPDGPLFRGLLSRSGDSSKPLLRGVMRADELDAALEAQLRAEETGFVSAPAVQALPSNTPTPNANRSQESSALQAAKVTKVVSRWMEQMRDNFDAFRTAHVANIVRHHAVRPAVNISPFLYILDKDEFLDIFRLTVEKLLEVRPGYSLPTGVYAAELGQLVQARLSFKLNRQLAVRHKVRRVWSEYRRIFYEEGVASRYSHRQWWLRATWAARLANPQLTPDFPVPQEAYRTVGRACLKFILRNATIPVKGQETPAFTQVLRRRGSFHYFELCSHASLARLLQRYSPSAVSFDVRYAPTLAPPVPYISRTTGGLFYSPPNLLRSIKREWLPPWVAWEAHVAALVPSRFTDLRLAPVFDALNQLGAVPWRVHSKVLEVALKVFRGGGDKDLDIPLSPDSYERPPKLGPELEPEARLQRWRLVRSIKKGNAENFGLWMTTLYQLSLAQSFADKVLWLPMNMDFRGRVYPMSPVLSHIGADLVRSMLVFAHGKPLGPHGLDWLKIHCVNLTGSLRRASTSERLALGNECMPLILDSARDPLGGKRWWCKSESPWQTLAVCFDIAAAVDSGDPASYVSCQHVHQDGSCNGLQHYAALGRDSEGARQVNLAPGDRPDDVYSSVLEVVLRKVEDDLPLDTPDGALARVVHGHVNRKVIKQTVMTTVYGVTQYGGWQQILRHLRIQGGVPSERASPAALYLAKKVFLSLGEVFQSIGLIQNWLARTAYVISAGLNDTVRWTTPLGLPVHQLYHRLSHQKTKAEGKSGSEVRDPLELELAASRKAVWSVNTRKQRNAFPPNFIHSLDSSHMMLAALGCQRRGLTFAAVHDSFWTHACDVDVLSKVCREEFVRLHSQPILETLVEQIRADHCARARQELREPQLPKKQRDVLSNSLATLDAHLAALPPKGTFDLSEVLKSPYFFA